MKIIIFILSLFSLSLSIVTSGSYTVGSGGDYASIKAASDDVGNLTGDLTFTVISSISEPGVTIITENLGGYTLKITSNDAFPGDPTQGNLLTGDCRISLQEEGPGTIIIEKLKTAFGTAGWYHSIITIATSHTIIIRDCMFNVGAGNYGWYVRDVDCVKKIYNNVFYNTTVGKTGITADANVFTLGDTIENCTFWGLGAGVSLGANPLVVRNCAAVGNTADYQPSAGGAAYIFNSVSTDLSANSANWNAGSANNKTGIIATNEFVSVLTTEPNFLKVKTGGVCDTGGVAPISINTAGIRGNDRPGTDTYTSIGADELSATAELNLSGFPQQYHFYGRGSNDSATITITGSTGCVSTTNLKVWSNGVLVDSLVDDSGFTFTPKIKAGLYQYKFSLFYHDSLVKTSDSIVCGDAYFVTGQSNAHSYQGYTTDRNIWVRAFGSFSIVDTVVRDDTLWHPAYAGSMTEQGYIGQWCLKLGSNIATYREMPTAWIQGGFGGSKISQHQYVDADTGIYGRLFYKVRKSGVKDNIKTAFWYQGESETSADIPHYQARFDSMHTSWLTECPNLDTTYLFVIRMGCYVGYDSTIRTEIRTMSEVVPKVKIIETDNFTNWLGCHYNAAGYTSIGNNVYSIMYPSSIKKKNTTAKRILLLMNAR